MRVAAILDASDHRGRVLAYYLGESWAIAELADLQMIEFFCAAFPESQGNSPF